MKDKLVTLKVLIGVLPLAGVLLFWVAGAVSFWEFVFLLISIFWLFIWTMDERK